MCLGFDRAKGEEASEPHHPLNYRHNGDTEDEVIRALLHGINWSKLQMNVVGNTVAFSKLP